MQAIAHSQGFISTLLLREDATRKTVLTVLREAAEALDKHSMLLLSYSGHGGYVPDLNGDDLDGQDETWCLYDGQLIDDELYELWATFRAGVRILVVSDSCHSGTMTKNIVNRQHYSEQSPKYQPHAYAANTYLRNKHMYDRILLKKRDPTKIAATVRLLVGKSPVQSIKLIK